MLDRRIQYAFEQTEILKRPSQLIATFGSSVIHYYVLTEPVYSEFAKDRPETVVREGKVSWSQPKLLTPNYMFRIEGFSKEAKKLFETLAYEYPELAGILYQFKVSKELKEMSFVPGSLLTVAENIGREIDKKGDSLSTIIKGVPDLWDLSLSKFILDMMIRSIYLAQIPDFRKKGFLGIDQIGQAIITKDKSGIPLIAQEEIGKLFKLAEEGELDPTKLKEELDKWGVFEQYQDRFFNLFRRKR